MLGVCYYPEHWPEEFWAEDARRMRELGLAYVRIGEFAWSRTEPRRGDFRWGWLDRAMNALGDAGLRIVLGTRLRRRPNGSWTSIRRSRPSTSKAGRADLARAGTPRSRRSSTGAKARKSSRRWRTVMAAIRRLSAGRPTTNTAATTPCCLGAREDLKALRDWLRRRYQTSEQLNEAWGSAFWSMDVQNFDEVSLPNLTVTEPNPAARLDFWRFQSGRLRPTTACNARSSAAIRPAGGHPQFHGLLQRIRSLAARRPPRFRLVEFLSDRPRRTLSVRRMRVLALARHLAPGHCALSPRPLSRRRPGAFLGDGAAAGPINWARWNPRRRAGWSACGRSKRTPTAPRS